MWDINRRQLLGVLGTLPFWLRQKLFAEQQGRIRTSVRAAERLIFVYHPDGVNPERWHLGSDHGWSAKDLPLSLQYLAPHMDQLRLLRRLNIGDGRGDGHPEPASMLLTGSKSVAAGSIDVHIADYFETPLIHLGVQASKYNGSSISFNIGGSEKVADDSPASAADRYFGGQQAVARPDDATLAQLKKDLQSLLGKLDGLEAIKLSEHLKQIERLSGLDQGCSAIGVDVSAYEESLKHQDQAVPLIFDLQSRILVNALKCTGSPVATLQFSRHTSPMKMDFEWLDGWDGRYPMESHQASHNDAEIHAQQKRWFNKQIAQLASMLAAEPEPHPAKSGSMLDHSLIVVVTEVSNGAAHTRRDMPYYLLGGAGISGLRGAGVLDCGNAPHSSLLSSLAQLIGMPPRGGYSEAPVLKNLFI